MTETQDNHGYQSEFTFLQHNGSTDPDYNFHQSAGSNFNLIPDTWILLDSQSTVSVFKNKSFLSNIRPSQRTLQVHTNSSTQLSIHIRTVTNFGDVWYNQK